MDIAIVIGLIVLAMIAFSTDRIPIAISVMIMLMTLVITDILTVEEAFAGFSNEFLVILLSIFIINAALQETGVIDLLGGFLIRIVRRKQHLLIIYLMGISGSFSGFMNNTTVTAIWIGPVLGIARRLKISPSKLLMPLAFGSILGGTCTLIGTSTNIAVSGYILKSGMDPIKMFELLPVGIVFLTAGIIYMFFIGRFLLPDNKESSSIQEDLHSYVSEIIITKDSPLAGQKIYQTQIGVMDLQVLNIIRDKINFMPSKFTVLAEDDILLVEGKVEELIKIKEKGGIEIMGDVLAANLLQTKDIKLAKLLVMPNSKILNNTIKYYHFNRKLGLVVIAINRMGRAISDKLDAVRLQVGDILLVQGNRDNIAASRNNPDFTVLEEFHPIIYKKRKGLITIAAFIAAIVIGSLEIIPLSISLLGAAIVTILIRGITPENVVKNINWQLLILIAGMTAFGTAMVNTGTSEMMATLIVDLLKPMGTLFILGGFMVLTVLLTQPMSNAAAALVILPVAIQSALSLGADPRSFAIGVMLSSSISIITPFEPSCLLIYGAGKYRFLDFIKIGTPLTIILLIILIILLPYFWPL